ncbi:LOW QUALITY PROTEIN: INVO-like protein [Mya arenaria]|uniref:INVO-like protein n=1 Tax=Mya arenaria TaxID=6604 RepID=A0ABY7DFW2_MYAAR|nr:LOW QUALITY PROTEIN: INVO-like protein [Mya arenaria]
MTVREGNFSSMTVREGNFSSMTVREGHFSSMTVREVNFSSMTVREGYFSSMTVREGYFNSMTVREGNFSSMTVRECYFSSMTVREGYFSTMTVREGYFSSMIVREGKFSIMTVREGNFSSLTVREGYFSSMTVREVYFSSMTVTEGNFSSMTVREGKFSSMTVREGKFSSMTVREGNFSIREGNFSSMIVIEGYFSSMTVREGYFSSMTVREVNFSSMTVREGNVSSMTVIEGNFSSMPVGEGNFSSMTVGDGNSSSMTAREGNCSKTTVREGIFSSMTVREVNFSSMTVKEVNFSSMTVRGSNFNSMTRGQNDNQRDRFNSMTLREGCYCSMTVRESNFSSITVRGGNSSSVTVKEVNFSSMTVGEDNFSSIALREGNFSGMTVGEGNFSSIAVGEGNFNSMAVIEGYSSSIAVREGNFSSMTVGAGNFSSIAVGEGNFSSIAVREVNFSVLPYWFSAATRGLVPKSGNTLVHVDGHSDMAPPVNVPGYPFFKWPAHRQIRYLMQSNDVFIQASAMANFINRLIWVWPDWDLTNHDEKYTMGTLSLGTVNMKKVNARRNSKSRDQVASQFSPFCMCMNNGTDVECWSLFDVERGNMSRERDEYTLRSDLCVIKKLLIVEELHESKAVAFFKNPKWSGRNESIVLDIDEDFYGCTYAVEPLLNTNFSMERLRRLNGIIVDFLCPLNASHEKASDIFLVDLVSSVRNNRACTINQELKNSSTCKEILDLKIIDHFSNKLRLLILSKSITTCQSKGTGVNQFVKDLVIFLAKMRIRQLRALQSVGFCASTSPRTLNKDNRMFVVCSGANTPEDSMVLVHRPTEKEITRRTIFLRSILRNIMKKTPGFVTIARSVRDGYTPRENFEQIERDVLTALNTTSSQRLNVIYDKELLGGKPGWPARHKV